jgi:hypothetical protein
MPRKNRCTALVLALALLVGLAGQAAVALPLGGHRSAANETSAGDFLATAWAWLTAQWSNLGQVVAAPARVVTGAWVKVSPGGDPNGGSGNCSHPGAPGTPP